LLNAALGLGHSSAWKELLNMVGLDSLKLEIKALTDLLIQNSERELEEEPLLQVSLNRSLIGNPGTGKTTVAGLLGQVFKDIGILSKGQVLFKTPADFVGHALGESERKTASILSNAMGNVLVIDEAYGLLAGNGNASMDPYRTAVADTIVSIVQNVPGEDRCVYLLGYKDQMDELFQKSNPGLARRFEACLHFPDFSDDDLVRVLNLKMK
jgi:SpoVK/Ycf46/Vps4 family AAA+-type ATPase